MQHRNKKKWAVFLGVFCWNCIFFLYLYAKTWKPICSYTWVCVNNGLWCKCLLLFFFSMLLCLSVKEKRTWSVKLIRISIFLLTSAFVNKIIWVFLKLCRNTLFFHFAIHLEFCGSSLIVFHSLQQGCWYRLLVGLKVTAASWWCATSVVRLWSSHCEPSLNHKA